MNCRPISPPDAASVRLAVSWRGEGQPVVVLHGGGPGCSSTSDFAGVAADLARAGRHLVFIDLPQFGRSDAPRIAGDSAGFHAACLAATLDRLGVRGADVLAQSLGGTVAMRLAADRPELVARIVAVGSQPVPFGDPADPRAALGRAVRERYYGAGRPTPAAMRRLLAEVEWHERAAIPDDLVMTRWRTSLLPGPLAFGVDHAGRGTPPDLTPLLGHVRCPVLLVWGRHDPFSGVDYAGRLARLLPDARVAVIDAAAHHPQSERPGEFLTAVGTFLAEVVSTRAPTAAGQSGGET